MHKWIVLRTILKFTFKFKLKQLPTCFGAFPKLGLLPNSATYTHRQGPTNICSHITTHRCILIGWFNNCNFSKHKWYAPWLWCDCTETCRSCFNVNFNVDCFQDKLLVHQLVDKKTLIIWGCTVCTWKLYLLFRYSWLKIWTFLNT